MGTPTNLTIAKQSLYVASSVNDLDPHQVAVDRDLQSLFRVAQKKIDGSRLTSLSNIQSTAGVIPAANLPTVKYPYATLGVSRDVSLSSDLSITGVGYKPSAVFVFMGDQATLGHMSFGFASSTNTNIGSGMRFTPPSAVNANENNLIFWEDAANNNGATIKSWDADGITLQWTMVNSPTGTAFLHFMFLP